MTRLTDTLRYCATVLLLGWPSYLLFNASGRSYSRWTSHFDPQAPLFTARQRIFVVLSDVGLLAVGLGLYVLGQAIGPRKLFFLYGVPYLVVNASLVLITLLQHTHPALPHYTDDEWDWLRGALTTVDRDYGPLLNAMHHHIADSHVAHHLFSELPHYHAVEATRALKKVLGDYYLKDQRFVLRALWEDIQACRYVRPDSKSTAGVLWYQGVAE